MLKETLAQYCDLREEIKCIRNWVDRLERQFKVRENEGFIVSDTVKGTRKDGTIGPIKISGYSMDEYYRRKQLLQKNIEKLFYKEGELLELTLAVEDFIEQQESSYIRLILRYRYLYDFTWVQIAHQMGRGCTADSCRKQHDRFFAQI